MESPFLFSAPKIQDDRGYFCKILDSAVLKKNGIESFQAKEMFSTLTKENGVRGMHVQVHPCASRKIVWVTQGRILDVVVNITTGDIFTFQLFVESDYLLYIPRNFAHGFQVLTKTSTVNYLVDAEYNQELDTGFHIGSFGFNWPRPVSVLSERDQSLMDFAEFRARG